MYDYVGNGDFHQAQREWDILKLDVIKYYGMHGTTYDAFKKMFEDGDYILTRINIDANKTRMYDLFFKMAQLIKTGGVTYEKSKDPREEILGKTKELYSDLLESYRLLSVKSPHNEKIKEECIILTDIIGDSLMDLRNLEPEFNKLGDYNIYSKYNAVRKQIGVCESTTPRIVDAFRTQQVKQKFEKEFGLLFQALEDLLAPVQEKNLKDYEDKIIKMFGEGKTMEEIAKELNVNPNTLSVYIDEHMDLEKLEAKK